MTTVEGGRSPRERRSWRSREPVPCCVAGTEDEQNSSSPRAHESSRSHGQQAVQEVPKG